MKFCADLHIHSHYSRATSKRLNFEHLHKWAQIKGLTVVGTGDLSHPGWLAEMKEKLEPSPNADGLFRLKPDFIRPHQAEVPYSCAADAYFILSGEISNIYKKDGAVRKIHHVVFFPSFQAVEKFQGALNRIGNIHSDGRPILGFDSRDLLEIVLETNPQGYLIPAHIWTPWFSLLGSKSGFDSVEACFEDLTPQLFAMETGLSSDPSMNWRLSMLDAFNLVSNSDAHSPDKLAREANIFDTDLSYQAIFNALKDRNDSGFLGTIEFFPEEGKYHMDGHRKCGRMLRPSETIQLEARCPVCGKPVTLGVSYRVEELADRPAGGAPEKTKSFTSLIPLPEVLSEVHQVGPRSRKVESHYHAMLRELGPELHILMDVSLADIEKHAGPIVSEAIRRMRTGQVYNEPGYDGEYGVIRIFKANERNEIARQAALFSTEASPAQKVDKDDAGRPPGSKPYIIRKRKVAAREKQTTAYVLNDEQQKIVHHRGAPLIIQAGPGTGKTRTLTHRLASLVETKDINPEEILAITFTNKAADEMRERLRILVGRDVTEKMRICTFHAFGLEILRSLSGFYGRNPGFTIIDPQNDELFRMSLGQKKGGKITRADLERISFFKGQLYFPENFPKEILENLSDKFVEIFRHYEELLVKLNSADLDDLIALPVRILRNDPELRRAWLQKIGCLAVDEFQDINQAQYELFRIFAISAKDVCVIGDPDQAIYGFRGASPDFFTMFQKDFAHARFVKLNRNYRSAKNILNASVQLLKGQSETGKEDIWSDIPAKVKIRIHEAQSARAEAEYIVQEIEKIIGGTSYFSIDSGRGQDGVDQGFGFADIAVLMRSRLLQPPLVEALSRSGIPFESADDSNILSAQSVKAIITALKIYNGQGGTSGDYYFLLNKFTESALRSQLDRELEVNAEIDRTRLRTWAEKYPSAGVEKFTQFINSLESLPEKMPVVELIAYVRQHLPATAEPEVKSSIRKMKNFAQTFDHQLALFLDAFMLQRSSDGLDKRADRVRLLTLHAAKGLEFPIVFIVGCEEGILPFALGFSFADIDEERRLLYVGMTRAGRCLYLTHAKTRVLHGQRHQQSPSRFMVSISDTLLQRARTKRFRSKDKGQMSLF